MTTDGVEVRMQNTRMGCLTLSSLITGAVVLTVIAGTILVSGNGMFSPGALNAVAGKTLGGVTSHAETGGDCGACHVAPWSPERMADRCQDCHADIATDMSKIARAHGEMLHNDSNLRCTHCHLEHRGADAPLTLEVATADFPHAVVGYSLKGHALTAEKKPFVCKDCHPRELVNFDPLLCTNCHVKLDQAFTQAHVQAWGQDCLACHDGMDTYTKHFDHGRVPFELTGAHVDVDCYSCHSQARTLLDLKSAPRDCEGCHATDEPHEGRFGTDCAECHTMQAWKPSIFDHDLTGFKLDGSHTEAACEDCHTTNPAELSMECVACHAQDDPHAGTFGRQCGACHKTTAWNDSPFDHNKSNFPLTGKHIGLDCEKCHKDNQFTGTTATCVGCHGYPSWHGSVFGANCLDCHTTNTWYNARLGSHPWFSHPHEGGMSMQNCRACHPVSVFESDCSSCHSGGIEGEN